MTGRQRRYEQLAWPEIQRLANGEGSTLIWPFGACEQHGPHLPLVTDALFAERITEAVVADLNPQLPIWSLPTQVIGFSPEHRSFPGTLSLSSDLLIAVVVQLGEQLAAMGWRRLVLFNAHGGQIALLQVAARELRQRCPAMAVLPCFLWSGVEGLADLLPAHELENGLHAGMAETSLMLHQAPELVGEQRPVDGLPGLEGRPCPPSGWSLEGAAPFAWLMQDLSHSGVIGDSSAASADLGKLLEQHLVVHWTKRLRALLVSDWPGPGEAVDRTSAS